VFEIEIGIVSIASQRSSMTQYRSTLSCSLIRRKRGKEGNEKKEKEVCTPFYFVLAQIWPCGE